MSGFRSSEKHPVIVVLENIRSMQNVGSVFRTSDAFLIEEIFLTGYTPCPPHRDIHKTALGATETVEWKHFSKTADAIPELKKQNYRIYAVEQVTDSIYLQSLAVSSGEKMALIFGNEATGVDETTLEFCDGCIEIPQFGMKHSLNISVAVGIVLWELVRKLNWQEV